MVGSSPPVRTGQPILANGVVWEVDVGVAPAVGFPIKSPNPLSFGRCWLDHRISLNPTSTWSPFAALPNLLTFVLFDLPTPSSFIPRILIMRDTGMTA